MKNGVILFYTKKKNEKKNVLLIDDLTPAINNSWIWAKYFTQLVVLLEQSLLPEMELITIDYQEWKNWMLKQTANKLILDLSGGMRVTSDYYFRTTRIYPLDTLHNMDREKKKLWYSYDGLPKVNIPESIQNIVIVDDWLVTWGTMLAWLDLVKSKVIDDISISVLWDFSLTADVEGIKVNSLIRKSRSDFWDFLNARDFFIVPYGWFSIESPYNISNGIQWIPYRFTLDSLQSNCSKVCPDLLSQFRRSLIDMNIKLFGERSISIDLRRFTHLLKDEWKIPTNDTWVLQNKLSSLIIF